MVENNLKKMKPIKPVTNAHPKFGDYKRPVEHKMPSSSLKEALVSLYEKHN